MQTERKRMKEVLNMASILEMVMLICFGFSWPVNFRKAWKAGNTKGTSLAFLCLVEVGYISGIAAKFLSGAINYVIIFYVLNLITVGANIVLYFINRKKEQTA